MLRNPLRLFTLLFTLLWLQPALAGGHLAGGEGSGQMRMMEKVGEELNLSENQKRDFLALLDLYRPRFEEIVRRGKDDRAALLAMAPGDPEYTVLAAKVSAEAARSAGETVTLLAELQGLVYALLSAEQQQTYLQLRAEQRAKMEEYRERRAAGEYPTKHHGHHGDGEACSCGMHADGYCPHEAPAEESTDGS